MSDNNNKKKIRKSTIGTYAYSIKILKKLMNWKKDQNKTFCPLKDLRNNVKLCISRCVCLRVAMHWSASS